jgi:hypothetical protein
MQLKTRILAAAAVATLLAAAGQAQAQPSSAPPVQPNAGSGYPYGYGCCGMMGGYGMMGPGMMGYGRGMMGPGMMGYYGGAPPANLNLSTNDVRAYLDRWVAMNGNPHVKVGPVTQRDANVIVGDIVTTEGGSLVQRFAFDRNTGAILSVQ